MKMNLDCAQEIQWYLLYLNHPKYPELHPQDFAMERVDISDESRERVWQSGVDILYRLLICGLIRCWPDCEHFGRNYGEALYPGWVREFCGLLANQTPFDGGAYELVDHPTTQLPWVGVDLLATNKLKTLLARHGFEVPSVKDYSLNPAFIESLEAEFEAHGVGWSDTPLIPISVTGRM